MGKLNFFFVFFKGYDGLELLRTSRAVVKIDYNYFRLLPRLLFVYFVYLKAL